jgi:hypothetical protein
LSTHAKDSFTVVNLYLWLGCELIFYYYYCSKLIAMPVRSSFLFAFLFFIVITVNAQYQRKGVNPLMRGNGNQSTTVGIPYTIEQLQGKWQEYKRTDHNNNDVPFTDSLQFSFWDKDSAQTQSSARARYKMVGIAEKDDDNTLMVAGDPYTVQYISKDKIELEDDDNIYWFTKTDDFFIGANKISSDNADSKDEFGAPVQTSLNTIMGNWSVYKKDVKPGVVNDKTWLIRYLNITTQTGSNTANAIVTVYTRANADSSTTVQKTATVTLNGTNVKIVTDTNTWDMPVYQADANNFVFGFKAFRYYCKPNGQ